MLDHVDFSELSDEPQNGEVDFNTILPSKHDIRQLKEYSIYLCQGIIKIII